MRDFGKIKKRGHFFVETIGQGLGPGELFFY